MTNFIQLSIHVEIIRMHYKDEIYYCHRMVGDHRRRGKRKTEKEAVDVAIMHLKQTIIFPIEIIIDYEIQKECYLPKEFIRMGEKRRVIRKGEFPGQHIL